MADENKLDTFQHRCLRRIFKTYWPMKASNEEVRRKINVELISIQVKRRLWQWIGHVLRMEKEATPRTAITWAPEGKRKRVRPRETRRRTVDKELKEFGLGSWAEASIVSRDRDGWRRMISCPVPRSGRRS